MRDKRGFYRKESAAGTISFRKIIIFLFLVLQINLMLSRLSKPLARDLPDNSSLMLGGADSKMMDILFPFASMWLLSGTSVIPPTVAPLLLSIVNLPVTQASWFSKRWHSARKGAGLLGNPLKALFSPGDYFMPTHSLEKILEKAGEQGNDVIREAGSEARVTIHETGKVVDGVIEKLSGKANEFVINLGKEGSLLVEKIGQEFRFTADDVLKKASKEGQIILEVAGFQAQLTTKVVGMELRNVITHAGNELRSISYELPRLARLVSSSFVAGAAEELKHQVFGSSELQMVSRAIDRYMRETSPPDLKVLLSYISGENHLSSQDKAMLYTKLIQYVNIPEIPDEARHKIYLIIGATALNDEKLFEEVDWYVFSYTRDHTSEILHSIPDSSVKNILVNGDEDKFLSAFGMLAAPPEISDGSLPIGTIVSFPEHILPGDFLECDGQEYRVKLLKDLYAIIGRRYGYRVDDGGAEYFNVPDYRGYFLRGWDHGSDLLGHSQEDATRMPHAAFFIENAGSHVHDAVESGLHDHQMAEDGEHSHSFDNAARGRHPGGGTLGRPEYWATIETSVNGKHRHSIFENGTHTHKIHSAGEHTHLLSGGDSETRPKNKNVKFMIKYQSSSVNLHKQIADLKGELKDVRESMQEKYQACLFFSTAAVVTGAVIVVSTKCFKR